MTARSDAEQEAASVPARRLEGKVGVVTGAGAGIGKATAVAFAREGATTVLADIDDEAGREACEEIVRSGGRAEFAHADMAAGADVRGLMDLVAERWDGLDILVNNAGVSVPGSATSISEAEWRRALDVNLTGVWLGMREAIPRMRGRGGAIVNVASIQAFVGIPGWAAYAASKGGVLALSTQAAVEYAPQGVRVNAIAPGTILTPMNERILARVENPERLLQSWHAAHPLGRVGEPAEVADAIVFLSSEESAFITGECLRVDGGVVVASSAGEVE